MATTAAPGGRGSTEPATLATAIRELAEIVVAHLEAAAQRYDPDVRAHHRTERARKLLRQLEAASPAPEAAAAAPPATLRAPERVGGPLRSRPVTDRTVFIVARELRTPNLDLRVGEGFPVQDIRAIRSYGAAYGVPDAETRPVETLDYVELRSAAGR